MAINQELLSQGEASADDWGPAGKYGNDEAFVSAGKEDEKLAERLGLDPISIRCPKAHRLVPSSGEPSTTTADCPSNCQTDSAPSSATDTAR